MLFSFDEIVSDCVYYECLVLKIALSLHFFTNIIGGSWDSGSATCPLYLGKHVVGDSNEDVILVTANYRLNVFGFLGGESMRDDDADGTTGNWGFLDQRRSMRWVSCSYVVSFL